MQEPSWVPVGSKADGRVNEAETPWELRAIPSLNAAVTAARTAEDGHELVADLFGRGARWNEPHRLVLRCEPHRLEADGLGFVETVERWPSFFPELIEAADFIVPGAVLQLVFFANPEGVPRVEVPPGTPRTIEVGQVGELKEPGKIELARA
jgi:hypothetical protein